MTDSLFLTIINDLDESKNLEQKDKEFIASFYKYAFLGTVLNWIGNNMQEDPKVIIDRLSVLVENGLSGAMESINNR